MADLLASDVEGVRELLQKLERLGPTARRTARKTLRVQAKIIAVDARARAPRDEGNLAKRGIVVRAGRRSRRQISMVVRTADRSRMGIPSKAKGFYPTHVEFGTKFMEAQPYLKPAFTANRDRAIDSIGSDVATAIIAEAKR